jgi:glycosyltransferase involved in cell wall biosynthesis
MSYEISTKFRKIGYDIKKSLYNIEKEIKNSSKGKKRILFLTPHLSTGGMPQYLLKKIEIFNDLAEIYCVQYENNAELYNVQRNKIRDILGDRFYCLGENKESLLTIIDEICPDVIHTEDFVEYFLPSEIIEKLYDPSRPYFMVETCHGSNYSMLGKTWVPDKFVMVNQYMVNRFDGNGVPVDLLEYPIEMFLRPDRDSYLREIGLDPGKKHVINVGLFTAGKNQGELIRYASQMLDYPVEFHFVGNNAPNFQPYWEPLFENLPENCRLWGERHDVDMFYKLADLFVFTSVLELNPIVVKESISWQVPILMRNLDVYLGQYDNQEFVYYLEEDEKKNLEKIKNLLEL